MNHSSIRIGESHNASLFLLDGTDLDPQTNAMCQAFYSRSTMSIGERLGDMDSEEVRESLKKFYLNYGHRSIGQCGNFTAYIEDVSIFAAKAIQHHPLYNGQETSTRYYDFAERDIIDPIGLTDHLESLRSLYSLVVGYAKQAYIQREIDNGKKITTTLERACVAKAFDVARCLLTAGFTTKLSWTTNFDQAQEHLRWLINSPVPELNSIGLGIGEALHQKYDKSMADPATFAQSSGNQFFDPTDDMLSVIRGQTLATSALIGESISDRTDDPTVVYSRFDSMLNVEAYREELHFLASRQRQVAVPRAYSAFGTFTFAFNIDYGSFRDLHRHRNGNVYFPCYSQSKKAMHPWYIDELVSLGILTQKGIGHATIGENIQHLYSWSIPRVIDAVAKVYAVGTPEHDAALMYYIPMGTMVSAVVRYDLPQAIYVAELRSGRTVHETARIAARGMAREIQRHMPNGVQLHIDTFNGVSEKRGEQTIFGADGESIK